MNLDYEFIIFNSSVSVFMLILHCTNHWFLLKQRLSGPQGMTIDWKPPGSPSSFLMKRVLRLDIPVDRHPNVSLSVTPP